MNSNEGNEFEAERNLSELVDLLVHALPEYSANSTFSATKHKTGWEFYFSPEFNKTWRNEVSIQLLCLSDGCTRVVLNASKYEGGLFKSKNTPLGKEREFNL